MSAAARGSNFRRCWTVRTASLATASGTGESLPTALTLLTSPRPAHHSPEQHLRGHRARGALHRGDLDHPAVTAGGDYGQDATTPRPRPTLVRLLAWLGDTSGTPARRTCATPPLSLPSPSSSTPPHRAPGRSGRPCPTPVGHQHRPAPPKPRPGRAEGLGVVCCPGRWCHACWVLEIGEGLRARCGLRHLHRRQEALVVHRAAPLSETGRLRPTRCVVDDGWPVRRNDSRSATPPPPAGPPATGSRASPDE